MFLTVEPMTVDDWNAVRGIYQASLLQAVGIVVLSIMMQAIFASLYYQAVGGMSSEDTGSALFAADEAMCYTRHIIWR